jgi:hypothetical protein
MSLGLAAGFPTDSAGFSACPQTITGDDQRPRANTNVTAPPKRYLLIALSSALPNAD